MINNTAEAAVKAAQLSNDMQSSGYAAMIKPQACAEVSRLFGVALRKYAHLGNDKINQPPILAVTGGLIT
jgi:hypothetical protein